MGPTVVGSTGEPSPMETSGSMSETVQWAASGPHPGYRQRLAGTQGPAGGGVGVLGLVGGVEAAVRVGGLPGHSLALRDAQANRECGCLRPTPALSWLPSWESSPPP